MCYVVVIRIVQFKDLDNQVSDQLDLAEKLASNIFLIVTNIV